MTAPNLREQLLKLRASVLNGEKWLADNARAVDKPETNRKTLRRIGRDLKSYAEAAGRNTGVAVFGPSQAGKSTLISALGRGPAGSLKADFGTHSLDFAMQINPEGGNETTGLVTRFSLAPAPPGPDRDKPVCLKLFSEMDIVKILTNTFFAEAKGVSRVEEEEMIRGLDALAGKPQDGTILPLDDLEDLEEYVKQLAPPDQSTYGRLLYQVFWARALRLADRRLGSSDRAELFSFLWGGLPPFTEVYRRLYKALSELNFAETAYCGLTVLFDGEVGRRFTVLHVNRLDGLLDGQSEDITGPPVEVISPAGDQAVLSRPVLSALIAELHVKVKEKPGELLEFSDLLDFPGYRAREKLEDIDQDLRKPEILKNCFLRGKVAYLFERYKARREIAAMLLCVGYSVQNNPDLPHIVKAWLHDTHGETPAQRAGRPISLFMILTMFDQHLQQGTSSSDTITRWETRLKASLLDFFKGHDWPARWSESAGRTAPFNNVFWLLNLSYASAFLELDEVDNQGSKLYRAKGLKDDQTAWLEEVRQGYLKSELVTAHIRRPEAAWQAVLEAPDGGVGYILEHLNPILAEADLQTAQLAGQARRGAEKAVEQVLRPWYHGAGSEMEMEIKKQSATELVQSLYELAREKQRFGELLRDLQLADDECQALYGAPSPEEEEAPEAEKASAADPSLDDIWGTPAGEPEARPAKPAVASNDASRRYRRRLERAWQDKLDEIAANPRHQNYFQLDLKLFQTLVNDLSLGAKRLNVFDLLETRLRKASSYSGDKPDQIVWKQARLAAAALSAYINWLGFSPREHDPAKRTVTIANRSMTLFEPPPPPGIWPELPDDQTDFDRPYYRDWTAALFSLMLDNVGSQSENYDRVQDERLGGILGEIETVMKVLS